MAFELLEKKRLITTITTNFTPATSDANTLAWDYFVMLSAQHLVLVKSIMAYRDQDYHLQMTKTARLVGSHLRIPSSRHTQIKDMAPTRTITMEGTVL